jgi:large subunit ribosomal protein L7A
VGKIPHFAVNPGTGGTTVLTELKTGPRVVGAKQTRRALNDRRVVCVYLAENADPAVTGPIKALCAERAVPTVAVSSMRELGDACGIAVGSAVAAVVR